MTFHFAEVHKMLLVAECGELLIEGAVLLPYYASCEPEERQEGKGGSAGFSFERIRAAREVAEVWSNPDRGDPMAA